MKTKLEVVSTQLKAVEYDTETEKLLVTFSNNKVYMYNNVPVEVFRNLVESDSLGRYFINNIKNNFKYSLM